MNMSTSVLELMQSASVPTTSGRQLSDHGRSKIISLKSGGPASLDYFAYIPARATQNSQVLVCVHGISRNAIEHLFRFAEFAEAEGICLIAPCFQRARFHHFQMLEKSEDGTCPADALDSVLWDFEMRFGIRTSRILMYGFSGGGQFAHRYIMMRAARVERLALVAPGWFTMPDEKTAYPYGIAASEQLDGRSVDITRLLDCPVRVFVGTKDVARNAQLNQEEIIDQMQGQNRLERACRWIEAMKEAAITNNIQADIDIELVEGAGHSFAKFVSKYNLTDAVGQWLASSNSVKAVS